MKSFQYIRNGSRGGFDWRLQGGTWQDDASAYLVAHDLYHHQLTDTGTYAQEVAAFGAEVYVSMEPLDGTDFEDESFKALALAGIDILANLADKKVVSVALRIPALQESPSVPARVRYILERTGEAVARGLVGYGVIGDADVAEYIQTFANQAALGYLKAAVRFPDQALVRQQFSSLKTALADLPEEEVPEGFPLEVRLDGYTWSFHYEDADAYYAETKAASVVWMPWYLEDGTTKMQGFTIHPSVEAVTAFGNAYAEHCSDHGSPFGREAMPVGLIPGGYASEAAPAYVITDHLMERLGTMEGLFLTTEFLKGYRSPKGVTVIGDLSSD